MDLITEDLDGLKITYRKDTRDRYIARQIIASNIYLVPSDLKDKIVIDIGAHIGAFSLLAASKGARVYSYEPCSENFKLLLKNKENNNSYIIAMCYAVSNYIGIHNLYLHSTNTGCHSLDFNINNFSEDSAFEPVSVVDIETVLSNICSIKTPNCALLKLDCEGAEEGILRDIIRLELFPRIDQLSVEFHSREFMHFILPILGREYKFTKKQSEFEWVFKR